MLELTPDFIKEFAVFLSTDRGLQNGSIWTNCMWLKGVVMRALPYPGAGADGCGNCEVITNAALSVLSPTALSFLW